MSEFVGGSSQAVPTPGESGAAYVAGIVHYGRDPGLAACVDSLAAQTLPARQVLVLDHDDDLPAQADLAHAHPEVVWSAGPNRGYSAGANRLLRDARVRACEASYFLLLNADVELEPEFAARLVEAMEERPRVALAAGKLLRPGGQVVDSAGITIDRRRRMQDRGAGEPEDGRFGRVEVVFAVSGAAMMIRISTLSELEIGGELFDEDFFAYHEDTDLAWRARLLGLDSLYVPQARAVHGRGWRQERRFEIAPSIRRHSFKNRYLELIKNEAWRPALRDLLPILGWEIVRFGFALIRDPRVLPGYWDAIRLSRRAFAKRGEIRRRVANATAPDRSLVDL